MTPGAWHSCYNELREEVIRLRTIFEKRCKALHISDRQAFAEIYHELVVLTGIDMASTPQDM